MRRYYMDERWLYGKLVKFNFTAPDHLTFELEGSHFKDAGERRRLTPFLQESTDDEVEIIIRCYYTRGGKESSEGKI
jgi:hypothetical protein